MTRLQQAAVILAVPLLLIILLFVGFCLTTEPNQTTYTTLDAD